MAKAKKKPAKHKAAAKPKSKAKAKAAAKPAAKQARRKTPVGLRPPVAEQPRRKTPVKLPPPAETRRKTPVGLPPAAPVESLESLDSVRNALADMLDDGPLLHTDPSMEEVGGRDAIHVELGAKLATMRGDLVQERAAIATAIESFMRLAIADGLAADASAYTAQCPEFFWEGDGANPPVYARVPDATHEEIGRWFQLIVEGVRAYDTRVGAIAPT